MKGHEFHALVEECFPGCPQWSGESTVLKADRDQWADAYYRMKDERDALAVHAAPPAAEPADTTWHVYVPEPISVTPDAPCRFCRQGSRHTNHYAQHPQPSAGPAAPGVTEHHPAEDALVKMRRETLSWAASCLAAYGLDGSLAHQEICDEMNRAAGQVRTPPHPAEGDLRVEIEPIPNQPYTCARIFRGGALVWSGVQYTALLREPSAGESAAGRTGDGTEPAADSCACRGGMTTNNPENRIEHGAGHCTAVPAGSGAPEVDTTAVIDPDEYACLHSMLKPDCLGCLHGQVWRSERALDASRAATKEAQAESDFFRQTANVATKNAADWQAELAAVRAAVEAVCDQFAEEHSRLGFRPAPFVEDVRAAIAGPTGDAGHG